MDEATARKIIENYLTGQAAPADFERALDFLKTSPGLDPSLAALYRDLDLPGGISHETAQELMPYYLEPLARAQLPQEERARFVAHLAQCPDCAADFLALQGFSSVPFPAPKLKAEPVKQTDKLLQPWPSLETAIQTFRKFFAINFSTFSARAVHETAETYQTSENGAEGFADYKVLFEGILEEDGTYLEASITAWRTNPTECDLQIELSDPLESGRQAGQTVIVSYPDKRLTQKTDEAGETVFLGLEIESLPALKIEIQLNS